MQTALDHPSLDITEKSLFRMEGSWGATQWEEGTLHITAWVNQDECRGGFEIYDVETGGNRVYAEGCLEFDDNCNDDRGVKIVLVDYDGVDSLDLRIVEWLADEGLIAQNPNDYFRKRINEANKN